MNKVQILPSLSFIMQVRNLYGHSNTSYRRAAGIRSVLWQTEVFLTAGIELVELLTFCNTSFYDYF